LRSISQIEMPPELRTAPKKETMIPQKKSAWRDRNSIWTTWTKSTSQSSLLEDRASEGGASSSRVSWVREGHFPETATAHRRVIERHAPSLSQFKAHLKAFDFPSATVAGTLPPWAGCRRGTAARNAKMNTGRPLRHCAKKTNHGTQALLRFTRTRTAWPVSSRKPISSVNKSKRHQCGLLGSGLHKH
jgi:hypothetical protein